MPATLQTASATQSSSSGLPVGASRGLQSMPFSDEEFHRIDDVPVFAEHATRRPSSIGPDGEPAEGEPIEFGPNELQLIAERCNRRIEDSGDYAIVCVGHNPTPQAKAAGAREPEVVGFAGPFRLGVLGAGPRKKYVILATFWIREDKLDVFKSHPRRSPEVWMDEDIAEMFLDPIALLGAETPRLDMGVMYGRGIRDDGREVVRYSSAAAMPGAGSVAIPGEVGDTSQYQSSEGAMQLSNDDIAAIVQAVTELPVIKFAEAKMAEEQAAGAGGGSAGTEEGPALHSEQAATADTDGLDGADDAIADPAPAPAEADPSPAPAPATDPTPTAPVAPVEPPASEDLPDDEYARYEAMSCGEMSDEDFEKYAASRMKRRKHYAAGSYEQGDGSEVASASVDESTASVASGSTAGSESYAKAQGDAVTPAQYAKANASLQGELAKLRAETEKLKGDAADGNRRATLQQLREVGIILDLDEEMGRCNYSRMSDDQFAAHTEAIAARYQRMPCNGLGGLGDAALAIARDTPGAGAQHSAERQAKVAKYAKQAVKMVTNDPSLNYDSVLESLIQSNGATHAAA